MNNNMEQQFLALVRIVEEMQQRILTLENTNQVLVRSNKQLIELMDEKEKELADYQRNLFYELNDPVASEKENGCQRVDREKGNWYPRIASAEETILRIREEKKSLARFGDGEFAAIAGRIRHRFQTESDEGLRQRLLEVLTVEEEDLLVGLADNYGSLTPYSQQSRREIRRYLNPQVRREHLALLDPGRTYYNAYVTRPYVLYGDHGGEGPGKRFAALRSIWEGRDCVFVEGCYTGMGVGNDLFDNAKSIRRILGPAENAFSCYSRILDACMEQEKDRLFLLALAPTATVLSYDLCRAGYQAVDVGHVDLEYEWFLRGMGKRTPVEGKYNNEGEQEQELFPIQDPEYRSQVWKDFS